jgi:hypothetical protein
MLGLDYWNAGMSMLFGTGFRAPMSTRCSPVTSCCTSSWYNITSKLYLLPCRDKVQRVGVLPTFRECSSSSSFYKRDTLQSSGRTHAHGMVGLLLCRSIARQCSVLASFSLTVLFIAKAEPWAAGKVMTLSPHGPGTCRHVHDFITLSRDVFVASASMMPEPATE